MDTIYFILDKNNSAIKIGYTSRDIRKRLSTLRTSNPSLVLIGTIRGNRKKEKELHRTFTNSNIDREWFSITEELIQFMNDNIEGKYIEFNDGELSVYKKMSK